MSKRILIATLVAAAVLAVGVVFYFFDPAQGGLYPSCLLHNLTGLNCPGCGGLRALHHLTHGELAAAFHSNPLLVALLPLITLLAWRRLNGGWGRVTNHPVFTRPVVIWSLLAVTLAFAVLRNLPWPAFAWMSP